MYQNPIRGTRLSKTDYPYFCRISFENRSRDMNISSPHTCIFQRKAFSECFCHDSNNDSDNVFRRTNNPRKGSWLLWHFQSLFYNAEHYIQNTYNELRTRTFALLCRPLLYISLTKHTKEKCRIDQQYIFHWWSVKIFNCLSFRRQFKKLTSLLPPSFIICLVHSRYTSYYTIEVDPNQNKWCKQSSHIGRMDCNPALTKVGLF